MSKWCPKHLAMGTVGPFYRAAKQPDSETYQSAPSSC